MKKKLNFMATLSFLAISVFFASPTQARPDVLCIYYPEWHVYPEGEEIFGKGRSEWDLVNTAKPFFPGHDQPVQLLDGCLDDSDPAAVAKEIDYAVDSGIDVFVYDWYWADGHPIQHEALERGFMKAPNRSRMKFALMWANHDRSNAFRPALGHSADKYWWKLKWTSEEFLEAIDYCIRTYFASPEYYRKDGKVFFSVYSAMRLIDRVGGPEKMKATLLAAQAKMKAAGLPPLHFSAMVHNVKDLPKAKAAGYDSVSSYNVTPYDFDDNDVGREVGRGHKQVLTHEEFAQCHRQYNTRIAKASELPYIPTATRGWDCTPRCRQDEPFPWASLSYPYLGVVSGLKPEIFRGILEDVRRQAENDPLKPGAILINAWNEYTEGCYLMPDKTSGRKYLDAVKSVFGKKSAPRVARTIRPAGTGFTFNENINTFLPLNDDYDVTLDGQEVEVRACRESRYPFNRYWPGRQRPLDQTERASYLAFEADGRVECRITPKHAFKKAVVRPLSAGVVPSVADGTISFTLPRPGYYVLETDGMQRALHMFMESPRTFPERAGATLSYGPGMHVAGLVRLKDHDRVYVDRDAIVFGCFIGENVKDVKVFGHGVIDGRVCERVFEGCYSPLQSSCLRFHGAKDVTVDGPVLMDSPNWVLAFFDCEDVDVRHVKIVGQWRYNTDGIDICNSRRVAVRDCFVRSFDDSLVIKGVPPYKDGAVEDVTVERCVLWCGWGKTIEPGIETWAPAFRRIRFSDCDVIHSVHSALNVSAGGTAVMEDFLFENIRVELQAGNPQPLYQRTDDMRYDVATRRPLPLLLQIDNTHYGRQTDEPYGHVRNCTFRGISVFTENGVPPLYINILSRKRPDGSMKPYENIVLENFSINGKAADWSEFKFTTNTPVRLVAPVPSRTMKFASPAQVMIDDGFWKPRYELWRKVTIPDILDKDEKLGHMMDNFDLAAKGANTGHRGASYYDGLVCEAIRGAADYLLRVPDDALAKRLCALAERIAAAQMPDGYLHTKVQVQGMKFKWGAGGSCALSLHEIYNAGCLVEAGMHLYCATGDTKLLGCGIRFANHLCDTIGPPPKRNIIPTHSLAEEALVELAALVRSDPKAAAAGGVKARPDDYLALVGYWYSNHGNNCGEPDWEKLGIRGGMNYVSHVSGLPHPPEWRPCWGDYQMDKKPLDDYASIEGHAVRATLMCAGLAAYAAETGDRRCFALASRFWDAFVGRKYYISGGAGTDPDPKLALENFAGDYVLPPDAYLETCAALGGAFFSARMAAITGDGKYMDEVERVACNAMLAEVSKDGKRYTYQNPLNTEKGVRWEWHGVPCCPPMFLKFSGALPGFAYAQDAAGFCVNLFMGGEAVLSSPVGRVKLEQRTDYPQQGDVEIVVRPVKPAAFTLKVRVPGWARGIENPFGLYTSDHSGRWSIAVNGQVVEKPLLRKGYAEIARTWNDGDRVRLELDMSPRKIRADSRVKELEGLFAEMRGPVLYAEEKGELIPFSEVANREPCPHRVWRKAQ